MKKNKLMFIVSLWIILASAILGFFLLAVTDKEGRESDVENRMLAAFPKLSISSLSDASFMSGFESFLSDAFFKRAEITAFTDSLTDIFNMMSDDDKAVVLEKDMEDKMVAEGAADADADQENLNEEEPPVEEDFILSEEEDSEEVLTSSKSFVWLEKVGGGNKLLTDYLRDDVATYTQTLRIMLNYMSADGEIYFAQVPLSYTANRWLNQQDLYCGWGSSVETMMRQMLTDEPRIHIFNAMDILEPHMQAGENMFYHTDHHWSAEGAYVLLEEMIASQNLPLVSYDDYQYESIVSSAEKNGVRDTYNVLSPLLPTHSYIITNLNKAKEINLMRSSASNYRVFLNSTQTPWRRITTGVNNDRRALIVCDSHGNAFAPWLFAYYEEVHMVDFRKDYYDKNKAGGNIGQLMQYYNIDDVYIIISGSNGLNKNNSIVYLRRYLTE